MHSEIAKLSEGDVWEVLRSFRVDGHLVELLYLPGTGYALVGYEADGRALLLGNPEATVDTAVRSSHWHKLRTWE